MFSQSYFLHTLTLTDSMKLTSLYTPPSPHPAKMVDRERTPRFNRANDNDGDVIVRDGHSSSDGEGSDVSKPQPPTSDTTPSPGHQSTKPQDTSKPAETPSPAIADRFNHEAIRAIPDNKFINVVVQALTTGGGNIVIPWLLPEHCTVAVTAEGSFNQCRMVDVLGKMTYVVKVPFAGTAGSWTKHDEEKMEAEIVLMQHIGRMSKIPVPEVVAHNCTLKSDFGLPYSITKKLPGKSAYEVWFVMENPDMDQHELWSHLTQSDDPSPALLEKRKKFLVSLAKTMAELDKVTFPATGMPSWRNGWRRAPEMAPQHYWNFLKDACDFSELALCESASEYFTRHLDSRCGEGFNPHDFEQYDPSVKNEIKNGARKAMELLTSTKAFKKSLEYPTGPGNAESFVVAHNDLDLQNILVDDDGNVTGILDWDAASIVPRSVGFATLPLFLRKEWLPYYSMTDGPFTSWSIEEYRQVNCKPMKDTGCADSRYTSKSAMYHAVRVALYEGGDNALFDILNRFFLEVPEVRALSTLQVLQNLGSGRSPALIQKLKHRFQEMLEPDEAPIYIKDGETYDPYELPTIDELVPTEIFIDFECPLEYLPAEENGKVFVYIMAPPKGLEPGHGTNDQIQGPTLINNEEKDSAPSDGLDISTQKGLLSCFLGDWRDGDIKLRDREFRKLVEQTDKLLAASRLARKDDHEEESISRCDSGVGSDDTVEDHSITSAAEVYDPMTQWVDLVPHLFPLGMPWTESFLERQISQWVDLMPTKVSYSVGSDDTVEDIPMISSTEYFDPMMQWVDLLPQIFPLGQPWDESLLERQIAQWVDLVPTNVSFSAG